MSDSSGRWMNVMVIGATGGIGKPLCMLLACSKFVKKLILCDIAPTGGLQIELSHINSSCEVKCQNEKNCDDDIDLVLMPCGKPQSGKDQKRDDLLKFNAKLFYQLVSDVAKRQKKCPAFLIVGNPVNSLTVICVEALKSVGKYDKRKIIGLNELDSLRARTFVAKECGGVESDDIHVPLVGGHSEKTICPILNKCTSGKNKTPLKLSEESMKRIFDDVRFAGDRVLEAYENKGTAILSTAYSCMLVVEAMNESRADDIRYAYVHHGFDDPNKQLPPFLTCPVSYDHEGIHEIYDPSELVKLAPDCKKLLEEVQLNIDVAKEIVKDLK